MLGNWTSLIVELMILTYRYLVVQLLRFHCQTFNIYICLKSCLSFRNIEQSEMEMLRKTMGLAMPLKLQMERNAAKKVRTHLTIILFFSIVPDL
jgi:hypothetical protein